MKQDTVEHDSMPRVTPEQEPPLTTETVSRIKLYEADHDLALRAQEQASVLYRQITLQEILREAIHIGLPLVAKRYKAAAEAAKKADKEN